MGALWPTLLEPLLNSLFIVYSSGMRHNGAMLPPLHHSIFMAIRPLLDLRWPGAGIVCIASMFLLAPAGADQADHDRAQQALQAGQVLPLHEVLQRIRQNYPGQVLEVELEEDGGRLIYEVKLLEPGGQVRKLKLNAQTAAILPRKNKFLTD